MTCAGTWPEAKSFSDLLRRLVQGLGDKHWQVGVILVDDPRMIDLNEQYRQADGVTDVLSFSYLEFEGTGEPNLVAEQAGARCDLWLGPQSQDDDGRVTVGEIVLAPLFIQRRCRAEGWPLTEELAMLTVHGCLHILGWQHDQSTDRSAMQALEKTILGTVDLDHPLLKRS